MFNKIKRLAGVEAQLAAIRELLEVIPVESRYQRDSDGEFSIIQTMAADKLEIPRASSTDACPGVKPFNRSKVCAAFLASAAACALFIPITSIRIRVRVIPENSPKSADKERKND